MADGSSRVRPDFRVTAAKSPVIATVGISMHFHAPNFARIELRRGRFVMARRIFLVAAAILAVVPSAGIAIEVERLALASGPPHRFSAPSPTPGQARKPVLGATAAIAEKESGLVFASRVDTGAKSCSIHAEDLMVIGGSPRMEEIPGKTVRFRICQSRRRAGVDQSVPLPKFHSSSIRTVTEWRYKVPMIFRCEGKGTRGSRFTE